MTGGGLCLTSLSLDGSRAMFLPLFLLFPYFSSHKPGGTVGPKSAVSFRVPSSLVAVFFGTVFFSFSQSPLSFSDASLFVSYSFAHAYVHAYMHLPFLSSCSCLIMIS